MQEQSRVHRKLNYRLFRFQDNLAWAANTKYHRSRGLNNRQIFHMSGAWKSKITGASTWNSWGSSSWFAASQTPSWGALPKSGENMLWYLSLPTGTLMPSWGVWPKSNHLPKTPPLDTTTLGVRPSTYEFGGDTNLQSVTQGLSRDIRHRALRILITEVGYDCD